MWKEWRRTNQEVWDYPIAPACTCLNKDFGFVFVGNNHGTILGWENRPIEKDCIEVVKNGISIRNAAAQFRISKSAFARHVKLDKIAPEAEKYVFKPNTTVRQIFTENEEKQLVSYLKTCGQMHYGLTTTQAS